MIAKSVKDFNKRHLTLFVWTARFLLGSVFIVSGLAKSIDIYGFIFKIEEYLQAWGMQEPRSLVTMTALFLSGFEFSIGVLMFTGAYKRVVCWLMAAMMAVMLPLTAYIWIADPVADCGCFGDALIISNAATFWKNVAITLLVVYLCCYNRRVKGFYHAYSQWLVVAATGIYILAVALYGYNVQPVVDFRSFKVGTPLVEQSDENADVVDDAFTFVYSKEGVEREFDIDSLPDDSWTFVDRKEKRPLKEIVGAERTDFAIYDSEGVNVTADVLAPEGYQLLIVIPQLSRADLSVTYFINELQMDSPEGESAPVIELVGGNASEARIWTDRSMAEMPVYTAEPTVLKELVRGDMGAVMLHDGRIVWKRTLSSINPDLLNGKGLDPFKGLVTFGVRQLIGFTLLYVVTLGLIYLLDISRKLFRRGKKHVRTEK